MLGCYLPDDRKEIKRIEEELQIIGFGISEESLLHYQKSRIICVYPKAANNCGRIVEPF